MLFNDHTIPKWYMIELHLHGEWWPIWSYT